MNSLPGFDSCDGANNGPGPNQGPSCGPFQEIPMLGSQKQLFSQEFMKVMQEMIRVEVRNYMSVLERNGVCMQTDAIRNSVLERMGIGRVE